MKASNDEVLILHSYSKDNIWTSRIDSSVKNILDPHASNLIIYTEFMDTKRNYSSKYQSQLTELFTTKYSQKNLKLLITSDDNAFKFALLNRAKIFNNAPIIFTGLNGYESYKVNVLKSESAYTGVVESLSISETIELALKTNPYAKELVFINTISTPSGRYVKSQILKSVNELKPSQKVRFIEDRSKEDIYKLAKNFSNDSVVIFGTYAKDINGFHYRYNETINKLAEISPVPVFGFFNFYLGHGLTGGVLTSAIDHGSIAGSMAVEYLFNDIAIEDISIITDLENQTKFDNNYLSKYKISINLLPANASFINNESRFELLYNDYTKEVTFGLALLFVLIFGIGLFSLYIRSKLILNKKLLKHNDELEKRVEDRTREITRQQEVIISSAKLASIGEMASGIAHEINNPLTIIKLLSEKIKRTTEEERVHLYTNKIDKMIIRISAIISSLKSLSKNDNSLKPTSVKFKEIVDGLLPLCETKFRENNIDLQINIPENLEVNGVPIQISQVMLNLLNNSFDEIVNSHSDRWIKVNGKRIGESIEVCVVDSGDNIPSEIADRIMEPFYSTKYDRTGTGLGLSICKKIVSGHGGHFYLDRAHKNTRFVMRLPKNNTSNDVSRSNGLQ